MVGFEEDLGILKRNLIEESDELDVISICRIGGMGKTTMARKLFHDPEIQYEFPVRIWISVSQEFSMKYALLSILRELTLLTEDIYHKSNAELAKLFSDYLGSAKFLLVLDDLWSIDDWHQIRHALPGNNKKCKVLITGRIWDVCHYTNPLRSPHVMYFLTIEESWLLLQLELFGKLKSPSELEVEGKHIANLCRGLPLAVVLIGGILGRKLLAADEISSVLGQPYHVVWSFSLTLHVQSPS